MDGECLKLALLCAIVVCGSLSCSFVIAASHLPANGDDDDDDHYYSHECEMCGKEGAYLRKDGHYRCSRCEQVWNS